MISSLCKVASYVHVNGYFHKCQESKSLGEVEGKFIQHIAEFGYSYGTPEEYNFRLGLFAEVDSELTKINQENTSFTVGHNFFSTLTKDEQRRRFGRKPQPEGNRANYIEDEAPAAARVDWRTAGGVNPVQDQGQCGSCWAFSATAAMEGAHFVKTGKLLKLSEQQFVDCDKLSDGCDGGLEIYAFKYAKYNPQELESSYPYTGKTGKCSAVVSKEVVTAISFVKVLPKSVPQLKRSIAVGPTCVSVDAEDN